MLPSIVIGMSELMCPSPVLASMFTGRSPGSANINAGRSPDVILRLIQFGAVTRFHADAAVAAPGAQHVKPPVRRMRPSPEVGIALPSRSLPSMVPSPGVQADRALEGTDGGDCRRRCADQWCPTVIGLDGAVTRSDLQVRVLRHANCRYAVF